MPDIREDDRRNHILDAALALLTSGGLEAVTTAALARESRCSKSTLYALFADRTAILSALVARQADALNAALDGIDGAMPPRDALAEAGARLLDLLTSPASLAINRAALADATGTLSHILVEAGRDRSAPKFLDLFRRLRSDGTVEFADEAEVYRCFYGLLIADRQILALHGVKGARPGRAERRRIASQAVAGTLRLHAPS